MHFDRYIDKENENKKEKKALASHWHGQREATKRLKCVYISVEGDPLLLNEIKFHSTNI